MIVIDSIEKTFFFSDVIMADTDISILVNWENFFKIGIECHGPQNFRKVEENIIWLYYSKMVVNVVAFSLKTSSIVDYGGKKEKTTSLPAFTNFQESRDHRKTPSCHPYMSLVNTQIILKWPPHLRTGNTFDTPQRQNALFYCL